MKKLLALLLAVLLALPAVSLGEETKFTYYASDFSNGTDGWYPRSAGSASIAVTEQGLFITGRSGTWNSPGRDFPLVSGKKYLVSVEVMQDAADSIDFMISAAHSKQGLESYENLGKATAKKGVWTTISTTYTPGTYDNYVLYVETTSHGTSDFTIRNFKVELDEIIFDMDLPSLSELYAPYFDFGSAVTMSEALDTERMDFYATQFNILTTGNELKPDYVFDIAASRQLATEDETAVAVKFDSAKPMLDYCQQNGIKVHGHVLVWHSQTPDVFFREGYKSTGAYVSREVMLARLDNYIRLIMEYMEANYPGLIVSWDVVNEAVADGSTELRESAWTRVVGDDFVNRAFEIARKYAPEGTKLYYNDYNTPTEPKLTGICNLLDSLVAEGNIDGYGFQAHYSSMSPAPSTVRRAMESIAAKGLRLRVSELDLTVTEDSELQRKIQAYRYTDLFEVFVELADKIDAVQIWGVTDDLSWKASEYPLLFDAKAQPKPSFYAVVEVVQPAAEAE